MVTNTAFIFHMCIPRGKDLFFSIKVRNTSILKIFIKTIIVFCYSEESEDERPVQKKNQSLKFKNKKEAMDAFKALLKEKVI